MTISSIIEPFLTKHSQPMRCATKWHSIAWVNKPGHIHVQYDKLVNSLFNPTGELSITETSRKLSIAYIEYEIQRLQQTGIATIDIHGVIMTPLKSNLERLYAGKGKQKYISSLYKESMKHL